MPIPPTSADADPESFSESRRNGRSLHESASPPSGGAEAKGLSDRAKPRSCGGRSWGARLKWSNETLRKWTPAHAEIDRRIIVSLSHSLDCPIGWKSCARENGLEGSRAARARTFRGRDGNAGTKGILPPRRGSLLAVLSSERVRGNRGDVRTARAQLRRTRQRTPQ